MILWNLLSQQQVPGKVSSGNDKGRLIVSGYNYRLYVAVYQALNVNLHSPIHKSQTTSDIITSMSPYSAGAGTRS